MTKRNAAILAPLAIAVAALPGVWVASASATGTSDGGLVHFYQVDDTNLGQYSNDNIGLVTMTGAIDDSGFDSETTTDNTITLSEGSFVVDVSKFGTGKTLLHVNDTNCTFESVTTGSVPIVVGPGTGAYKLLSGTFDVKATTVGLLPRIGGANGPCDTSQAGQMASTTWGDIIEATANVSFSG